MGGHPYWYFVPYRKDLQGALDDLREREFKAGRYNPVIRFIKFSEPAFSRQKPGPDHASIDEAMEAAAEEGTRSILDIAEIGARSDYGTASPLDADRLKELYGTVEPTHDQLAGDMGFLDELERGKCVYVLVYEKGKPSEILFAGYSYD